MRTCTAAGADDCRFVLVLLANGVLDLDVGSLPWWDRGRTRSRQAPPVPRRGLLATAAVGSPPPPIGSCEVDVVQPLCRRSLLLAAVAAVASAAAGGCTSEIGPSPSTAGRDAARLIARPASPGGAPVVAAPGLRALDLGSGPEVLLRVPAGAGEGAPPRLVLTFHGAGGNGRAGLAPLLPLADANRLLLLAPTSQGSTWDVIRGGWGPDVRRIDDALAQVFASYRVDRARLGVSGFSDGASYALSLGLANADLFTHVIAFSPGFVAPAPRVGTPSVFISHGRADAVLPIDRTTRRILPQLRAANVPTEVREFDGPHTVPPVIAEDAVCWLDG